MFIMIISFLVVDGERLSTMYLKLASFCSIRVMSTAMRNLSFGPVNLFQRKGKLSMIEI